ncbi:hypothetical protein SRHO_G00317240 [Serrasalmus rhombeus]
MLLQLLNCSFLLSVVESCLSKESSTNRNYFSRCTGPSINPVIHFAVSFHWAGSGIEAAHMHRSIPACRAEIRALAPLLVEGQLQKRQVVHA